MFSVEFDLSLIFQWFKGILVLEWWFLMVLKLVEYLILVCFIEVGIEVVFWVGFGEISRKRWFYKGFVDRTDVPVYLVNKRSQNVNYAPIYTEQTFLNIL